MKTINFLAIVTIVLVWFTGCNSDCEESIKDSHKESLTATRSVDEDDLSPLNPGIISLDYENAKTSYYNGYKAENIPFASQYRIYANYTDINDSILIKSFQNVVKIYDETDNLKQEYIVTLVPTKEYCEANEMFDWNDFLFYDKNSDFSGYEIISDYNEGKICGAYYYENGVRQYGTFLTDGAKSLSLKTAFLLKIVNNLSFLKIINKSREGYAYHEETEMITDTVLIDGKRKEIEVEIKWITVVRLEDSFLDCDESRILFIGSGGRRDEVDYLQQDYVETEGSVFFSDRFISEYPLEGGAESSSCYSISIALKHFGVGLTPDEIWQSIDNDDSGTFLNIFNDYIQKEDLNLLMTKYLNFLNISPLSIRSNISNNRPCMAVYKTGTGVCVYKCVFVIGYTINNEIIYVDPITCLAKKRPNDFLEGYCFAIYGSK